MKGKQMPKNKCKKMNVMVTNCGRSQIYELTFNSSSVFILGTKHLWRAANKKEKMTEKEWKE